MEKSIMTDTLRHDDVKVNTDSQKVNIEGSVSQINNLFIFSPPKFNWNTQIHPVDKEWEAEATVGSILLYVYYSKENRNFNARCIIFSKEYEVKDNNSLQSGMNAAEKLYVKVVQEMFLEYGFKKAKTIQVNLDFL